ncbi:putative F-box domain, leucine-rich repeat domain superfamily, F-box-like domain superfamily [Helianthus annuus]|uniref:F-box domain, leucine-rich repeat domain superfamily, F-box-like domain superfamily n=1 Tax=Helianthus annuus TaxID=4232 RepID=A0A251UYR9_HELAN|nr:F-box protein SKIP19 [Helianthus annuus]KAF5810691.1 putative F-box domain, leucine-rich repeat domain superfamily, F-box-like domain superfamily [Helianthus annuus]KAJ0581476.1 putative F-box domain, leucine-rich repeat domain superfamily, F-box-like domain superfamily [Helianthus annuus]KAJ0589431.1 putative F-box domain, leucine-rich repeat domain superfamily, F-box-like domain superfamily [Helianthus annuus]KAJ0597426.1 putative F-box domain, leucine-rich repeat domain superfamily, F-box
MASTSATEPPSAAEQTPNWLQMPHELMSMILQRLDAVEVLNSAQKVCTTWRKICKDPAMWKVINMLESDPDSDFDLEKLTKHAIDRSCGELIDVNLEWFCTDDLLDHISKFSNKLKCLCLSNCYNVTSSGLSNAVKKLPQLEQLHLYYTSINVEDIEVIGQNCPHLKSFKLNKEFSRPHIEFDGDAFAIANNMPELRHLQLFGNKMTNEGLQAILHGCPHLEFLDVRRCFNLNLGAGNLGKLCVERIKEFKHPNDSTKNCGFIVRAHAYDDIDDMYSSGYSDADDFSEDEFYEEDYEFSGGSVISEEDDYDYYD